MTHNENNPSASSNQLLSEGETSATPGLKPPALSEDQVADASAQTGDREGKPSAETDDAKRGNTPPPIFPRRQPASWEEREPENSFRLVKHLDVRNLEGTKNWYIAGASRRGKMHAHEAKYREDAWHAAKSREGGWNIVAVADGGGSYALSRIGSHVAVFTAVEALAKNLPEIEFIDNSIRSAFATALNEAFSALEVEATELARTYDKQVTVRDLSTTLLLLAYCPEQNLVGVAQVGDGLLVLQKDDSTPLKLLDGDHGEVAGATIFLNNIKHRNWDQRIRVYKLKEKPHMVVAMTDGVADDVLDNEQNYQVLFDAVAHFIKSGNAAVAMSEWLAYEKRGSFDDRTIVVIYPW